MRRLHPGLAPDRAPGARAGAALAAATLLLLLLPWLARHDASNWTWGLNVVRYLQPGVLNRTLTAGLAALALGLAAAALSRPRAAEPALPRDGVTTALPRTVPTPPLPRVPSGSPISLLFSTRGWPLQALLCAAAATGFWTWRERIHFLSDTLLRLRSMDRMVADHMSVSAWALSAAPLDYNLGVRLPVWLARTGVLEVSHAAQLVPCVIGAVFVALAIRVAALTSDSTAGRLVVLAVLVTQGYIELFAGYCKGYGLLLTVLLGWFAAALSEQRAGRRPGWSLVLFGLALLTHRTGLLLAPAQVWLMWRSRAAGPRGGARARTAAVVFATLGAISLAASWWGLAGKDLRLMAYSLHPGAEPGAYPLWSAVHAANVLDDLFLIAPVGLAGLLLLPWARRGGPGWGALLLAGAPFVALALLVVSLPPVQGAARDWDNFASAGLFLALLAARGAARAVGEHPRLAGLAGAMVLAGALHTAAWVGLNANPAAALARVEAVGRGVPRLPLSARAMLFEYLGEFHELQGRPAQSAEAYLAATQLAPNPRYFVFAGVQLWKAGRRAEASAAFQRSVDRDPGMRRALFDMYMNLLDRDPGDSLGLAIRAVVWPAPAGAPGQRVGGGAVGP